MPHIMAVSTISSIYYPVEETSLTYNGLKYNFRRYADFVAIMYDGQSPITLSTNWTNIGTLPSQYRPRVNTYTAGSTASSVSIIFRILITGSVDIMATASSSFYPQGSAIYVVR